MLGAGDGFFSGLLKGWLEDADWPTALKYANACGAFAVSRHGCTPAYPSLAELEFFLARGIVRPDLRHDQALEQIHWSTNRSGRLVRDAGLRLRPPDAARADGGRHGREDRRLQEALPRRRRSRSRTGVPATASSATTGSAGPRCTRPRAPASGSAGPANGRARGR